MFLKSILSKQLRSGKMIKFISWNVNGLRSCMNKGFLDYFMNIGADIFCIQETKLQPDQIDFRPEGYDAYWNCAVKKGYSGVSVFSRLKPAAVCYGIGIEEFDEEGRMITLEFDRFYLVNLYSPNSRRGITRLDFRMKWEDELRSYLGKLKEAKEVVVCGDFNVAHREIDLKNPESNRKNAGFTDEEREKFGQLLDSGFIDTFRYLYPDRKNAYTWWSYMFNARAKNIGWRIDYFCVSEGLRDLIVKAEIHDSIMGSDHCPIELVLDL